MSSDPLARPDIWTGAPNEAEYDAVYAAVTATERGRWFLSEFANRNRHADTDALTGALARVEAAIRGERTAQSPSDSAIATPRPTGPGIRRSGPRPSFSAVPLFRENVGADHLPKLASKALPPSAPVAAAIRRAPAV